MIHLGSGGPARVSACPMATGPCERSVKLAPSNANLWKKSMAFLCPRLSSKNFRLSTLQKKIWRNEKVSPALPWTRFNFLKVGYDCLRSVHVLSTHNFRLPTLRKKSYDQIKNFVITTLTNYEHFPCLFTISTRSFTLQNRIINKNHQMVRTGWTDQLWVRLFVN